MFIWLPPTEAPDSRPVPVKESESPLNSPDFFELPDSGPLRAIRDFAGMPLRWVPLKTDFWQQAYELRCGEEILGLMHFEKISRIFRPCSSRGLARTKEATWSFRVYGAEVAIETDKGERTLVRPYGGRGTLMPPFRTVTSGATLSLPNGHDYFFRSWGFFTTYCRWLTADNTPLISASVRERFMTPPTGGDVEVHPPAAALPELDLLIALGWYFVLGPLDR